MEIYYSPLLLLVVPIDEKLDEGIVKQVINCTVGEDPLIRDFSVSEGKSCSLFSF